MSSHFEDIIEKGNIPIGLTADEGQKVMDEIVEYLCTPERRAKRLTDQEYTNLIHLLQELWWCAESGLGKMLKNCRHLDFLRGLLKDRVDLRSDYSAFVDKLITQLERRKTLNDWEQDAREPDYNKIIETLEQVRDGVSPNCPECGKAALQETSKHGPYITVMRCSACKKRHVVVDPELKSQLHLFAEAVEDSEKRY